MGPMMSFHAGSKQVIQGIPQEIVQKLQDRGASPGHVRDTTGFCSTVTPFDPETLKQVLFEMCAEEQIELFLHTVVTDVVLDAKRVKGIVGSFKTSKLLIMAERVIDCTGDGDIAALAGAPFVIGRETDNLTQPMTLMFRMGGCNLERVLDYMRAHPEDFRIAPDVDLNALTVEQIHSVNGFYSLVRKAKDAGDLNFPCDRVLFFPGTHRDEVTVNMTRVLRLASTEDEEMTRAEISGRGQVFQVAAFLQNYIPGFEKSWVIDTGMYIGVRESRHILGKHVLSLDDLLSARKFRSAIACGGYPVDIHNPEGEGVVERHLPTGEYYTIPYESLLPQNLDHLLVAGRCISATHEAAGAIRLSPIAMAIGQAAGVAAALSLKRGVSPHELEADVVRQQLRGQGAFIS